MKKAEQHELTLRCGDLENAMRAIGKMLVDQGVAPKRRIDMALGVLWRYGFEPIEPEKASTSLYIKGANDGV